MLRQRWRYLLTRCSALRVQRCHAARDSEPPANFMLKGQPPLAPRGSIAALATPLARLARVEIRLPAAGLADHGQDEAVIGRICPCHGSPSSDRRSPQCPCIASSSRKSAPPPIPAMSAIAASTASLAIDLGFVLVALAGGRA